MLKFLSCDSLQSRKSGIGLVNENIENHCSKGFPTPNTANQDDKSRSCKTQKPRTTALKFLLFY